MITREAQEMVAKAGKKAPAIDANDGVIVTAINEATERSIAEGRRVQIVDMIGK